jgi:hypothetical protein
VKTKRLFLFIACLPVLRRHSQVYFDPAEICEAQFELKFQQISRCFELYSN